MATSIKVSYNALITKDTSSIVAYVRFIRNHLVGESKAHAVSLLESLALETGSAVDGLFDEKRQVIGSLSRMQTAVRVLSAGFSPEEISEALCKHGTTLGARLDRAYYAYAQLSREGKVRKVSKKHEPSKGEAERVMAIVRSDVETSTLKDGPKGDGAPKQPRASKLPPEIVDAVRDALARNVMTMEIVAAITALKGR